MARFEVLLPSAYPAGAGSDLGPVLAAEVTGWVLTGQEARREASADVALLVPVPGGGLAVLTREWLVRMLAEAAGTNTATGPQVQGEPAAAPSTHGETSGPEAEPLGGRR